MASQVAATLPRNEYCVIDNGPAPAASVLDFTKAPIGYDTTTGSQFQDTNAISAAVNSSIPDWRNKAVTTVLNSPLSTRLLFLNPA